MRDLRVISSKSDKYYYYYICNTIFLPGEALDLAGDMATEVNRTFPGKSTVHALVERSRGCTPNEVHNAKSGFGAARCATTPFACSIPKNQCAFLKPKLLFSRLSISLRDLLLSLRLPVAERIPHIIRDEAHVIFNYCHLTHGYGPDAVS